MTTKIKPRTDAELAEIHRRFRGFAAIREELRRGSKEIRNA